MTVNFHKSGLNDAKNLINAYLQTLTGIIDDYWEEHIIDADIYEICNSNDAIGCFSIYGNNKISMFYLKPNWMYLAQSTFKRILSEYCIQTAFVTTCDMLFLNMCIDYHKEIKPQAYFIGGIPVMDIREPEYKRELISEIKAEEIEAINKKTDNFYDFASEETYATCGHKIYRLAENGVDLGYGNYNPCKLNPQYYACGMVTLPEHRNKGVGRSILIHLASIVKEAGHIPVFGLGYGNTLSKKTIESAGWYNSVRLLNVSFINGGI
jgi:GNAT superfamily N-acetyltransferase